jgi:hypothetical protein
MQTAKWTGRPDDQKNFRKEDICLCSLCNTKSSSPGTGSCKVGKADAIRHHFFLVSIVIPH